VLVTLYFLLSDIGGVAMNLLHFVSRSDPCSDHCLSFDFSAVMLLIGQ